MQRAYVQNDTLKDTTPQPGLGHLDVTHMYAPLRYQVQQVAHAQALSCRIPQHVFRFKQEVSGPAEESSGVFVGALSAMQLSS
jgi:hypothetical protein